MDPTCGLANNFRDQLWEPLLYLLYYHRNTVQLDQGLEELADKRSFIQRRIYEARNNREEIKHEVLDWLLRVDKILQRARKFCVEASQAETKCSITLCPNLCLRYELSKRAKAMAQQVADICREANFGSVSYRLPPKRGMEPEQDIKPTQDSSSNTEELPPQQNHDAANNASVHVASNRVNRDFNAVNEESAASAPISICESTNFSTWERGKRIGAGGYGTVYVLHDKETGRSCAVKELRDIHKTEDILKEIDILRRLKPHGNIVKYYGHKQVEGRISLYMEYIVQGSLKQYISKRGVLDEPQIRKFVAQILSGLVHLHGERVVHRDLKPDNILIDHGDILKLVDFGLAKKLEESVGKHSELGTPYYAAPEVLKKIKYKNSREASAADIWSLGCITIEMYTGKRPWADFEYIQVVYKVGVYMEHPPIPGKLCSEGQDFLRLCFERPAERPSAEELLRHPFVKAKGTELEQDMRPTQASSLNTKELPRQRIHDADKTFRYLGDVSPTTWSHGLTTLRYRVPGTQFKIS